MERVGNNMVYYRCNQPLGEVKVELAQSVGGSGSNMSSAKTGTFTMEKDGYLTAQLAGGSGSSNTWIKVNGVTLSSSQFHTLIPLKKGDVVSHSYQCVGYNSNYVVLSYSIFYVFI